jgi:RNA polymerase subunit RPABC4/transcription elongation factor Spt4
MVRDDEMNICNKCKSIIVNGRCLKCEMVKLDENWKEPVDITEMSNILTKMYELAVMAIDIATQIKMETEKIE